MSTLVDAHAKGTPVLPRTKQTSRKKTKAWRKNIDITHEEHVLEEIREQNRLGYQNLLLIFRLLFNYEESKYLKKFILNISI